MKKYLKVILYILSFVIFIILAVWGYKYLTTKYSPVKIEQAEGSNTTTKAIDFEVLNSNKESVKLSDFYGKPIVVNFWATWCGPCRNELPEFEEAYKKYNEQVEFLMVNLTDGYSETVEGVEKFISDNKYEFPVYFDTEYSASNAYSIYSIPRTLFIDKQGNILNSYLGMMDEETLEKYIVTLIGD